MSATTTPLKYIGYDRTTKDYMAFYDGNVIGFFPSYHDAECALDDYVLGLAQDGLLDLPLAAIEAGPPVAPAPDEPGDGPTIPIGEPHPDAGRAIARQWLRDRKHFLATFAQLGPIDRVKVAIAYAAYMAPMNRTGAPLTAEHQLMVWHRALDLELLKDKPTPPTFDRNAPLTRSYLATQLAERAERRGDVERAEKMRALAS